jgi:hypothetical protein
MNKKLQKQLGIVENMIGIQKNCVIVNDPSMQYMHGMLNGLICAYSVFSESEPKYVTRPGRKRGTKVRHKTTRK